MSQPQTDLERQLHALTVTVVGVLGAGLAATNRSRPGSFPLQRHTIMPQDPRTEALAIWLHSQQQASRLAQQQAAPGELHLHQHHHAAPAPPPVIEPEQPQVARMHPLFVAAYMLFLSVAISLPIALIAAIVESSSRPQVIYQQPSRGGW